MDARVDKPDNANFPIAIIGAGFSGLGMAIRLKQAGIESFTLFERADEVGGTWRDNAYPGAACDVSSHLYSFSFEQKPDWSRAFAEQPEIQQYILELTEKHGLRSHVRFNTEIVKAVFDQGSGLWTLYDRAGQHWRARALISGTGGLSDPKIPEIEGLEHFEGPMFHTARWDAACDLRGKRVAVIGSGASAIQVVPAIAPEVAELKVFQRTPPWIMPKMDRPMREAEKRRYRRFPPALWLRRLWLYWAAELRAPLLISNRPLFKRLLRRLALKHIQSQVSDPALRQRVIPDYNVGCKRVLISNDWYPALQRENVSLIDQGVKAVTSHGVVASDGSEHDVDVIVLATGFNTPTAAAPLDIRGLGGVTLNEAWRNGSEAYKGVTVSGFPNLFLLVGPNTGPGHTSVLVYLEKQLDYVMQALDYMRRHRLKYLNVLPEVQKDFNDWLQARMQDTVWVAGGCDSWYITEDGKNTSLYPGFATDYRLRVSRFRPAEYQRVALLEQSSDSTTRTVTDTA